MQSNSKRLCQNWEQTQLEMAINICHLQCNRIGPAINWYTVHCLDELRNSCVSSTYCSRACNSPYCSAMCHQVYITWAAL
jgi:hypothetical protein